MIYFGTSGYSYDDWAGIFYPAGMPKREWLSFYAREFNAVELNSTYYAIPQPQAIASLVRRTGDGFLFAVRAHHDMTHNHPDNAPAFSSFLSAIRPIAAAGKLACILAQFPYSFENDRRNWDYLELFREKMADLPLVAEFRNPHWLKPNVFQWLQQEGVGFCHVDEPAIPDAVRHVVQATGPLACVRLHGRNSAKWLQYDHANERYDYKYSDEELAEWAPRIQKLGKTARRTLVFASNYSNGQAVDTIRRLRLMVH